MILYCYNTQGVYVGPVAAPLSPARPFQDGAPNYLRPANCTDEAPPEAGPGQTALFDGQAWTLKEDHRGQTAYQTATRRPVPVTSPGPLPDGFTLLAPPSDCCVWTGSAWEADPLLLLVRLRQERNAKLAATDWTQLPDTALSDDARQAWRAYRQALRDLTHGWTQDTPWPTAPQE